MNPLASTPSTGSSTPPAAAQAEAAASASGALTGSVPGGQLGKQEFLQLLVTQLSNQDPLNPMDGQQFAAQLAQFSSVEQLIGVNEALAGQAELQSALAQNMSNGVATSLVGHEVRVSGASVTLGPSGSAPLSFRLEAPAPSVEIVIRDASGATVRTLPPQQMDGGEQTVSWDGTGDDGERLAAGSYSFEVRATDADGNAIPTSSYLQGRVERISFGPDGARLWVAGVPVPLSAVESVIYASDEG